MIWVVILYSFVNYDSQERAPCIEKKNLMSFKGFFFINRDLLSLPGTWQV